MEVINLTHLDDQISQKPHIMAIGFFDGVHLGHQELLNRAKELARKQNVLFTAMTFSPHPDEVLKGNKNRKYLMTLPEKIKKMEAMGVDKLFVMEFDRTFASFLPADFIQRYILNSNTKHVVVGFDFTFGFKAQGNTQLLQKESKKVGLVYRLSLKNLLAGKNKLYAYKKIGHGRECECGALLCRLEL